MPFIMKLYFYYETLRIKDRSINQSFRQDIKILINLLQQMISVKDTIEIKNEIK